MYRRIAAITGTAAFALLSFGTPLRAAVQDKPQDITIKDDTTPKVKKGAKVVSDATITTEVKTRLMKDKVARRSSIDVSTKDGVVTLAGAVPTEADRARIGRLVGKTAGVKSVDNNLTVSTTATGTTGKGDISVPVPDKSDVKRGTEKVTGATKKSGEVVADASITTAVKTRLMTDDVARGTHIDVDTSDGVVTIAGTVPTEADRARIGQLVANTTGVKRVVNNLTVR
jgi:hyperosmotically inducible periplasmic protein